MIPVFPAFTLVVTIKDISGFHEQLRASHFYEMLEDGADRPFGSGSSFAYDTFCLSADGLWKHGQRGALMSPDINLKTNYAHGKYVG